MTSSPGPRVVHVITGLATGGAEHSLLRLLAGQDGAYESAVVSLTGDGPVGARIAELGVRVHDLGMRRGRGGPAAALRLARLLRQLRPDLIQGWMYHGNLAAWAARAITRSPAPLAWNVRHTPGELAREKRLTGRVIRAGAWLSRSPRAIIYNSWASAVRHEELGYSSQRRQVIPNGFDTERFRPRADARERIRAELELDPGAVVIGMVARYHPVKGHDGFLAAAQRVAHTAPETRFVLAGRGAAWDNEGLADQVEDLGLTGRVRLLGERADVPDVLAAFDVACLASRAEGFPNAVGEAMACAVPCVVTDVGDAARIVGDSGVVVAPGDPAALAGGLLQLVALGPGERRRLGEQARDRIVRDFGVLRMLERYDSLYRELYDVRHHRIRPARPAP